MPLIWMGVPAKSGICGKYPQGKPGSVFNSQRWCGEYSPESE